MLKRKIRNKYVMQKENFAVLTIFITAIFLSTFINISNAISNKSINPLSQNSTIKLYKFVRAFGQNGTGNGQFGLHNGPYGIAVDHSNNVYVTDYDNNRIQKFDSNGNFITKWGEEGSKNGQFDGPNGIAIGSTGYVYVSDQGNARIQVFSPIGLNS